MPSRKTRQTPMSSPQSTLAQSAPCDIMRLEVSSNTTVRQLIALNAYECYKILGASPDWSLEQIKRAFRKRLLAVHPDRNPDDPLACERTRRLLEAYQIICRYSDRTISPAATAQRCRPSTVTYYQDKSSDNNWFAKTCGVLVVLILMSFAVHVAITTILGERVPVFRPDPAALSQIEPPRNPPLVVEPDLNNWILWYWTQRYQLSLDNTWIRTQAIRAYSQAAVEATLRGDESKLLFCRIALTQILNDQRCLTPLCRQHTAGEHTTPAHQATQT